MRKNKIFVIGLLGLFGLLGLTGCAKREIKNLNSKSTNIICFGDSITFGSGAESGENYPSLLAKMINFPVINAGAGGDTTSSALNRLESDVLEKEPLLVIVELGGNDFLNKVPIEVTIKNMREIVEKIQNKEAMVAIVDIGGGIFLGGYHKVFYKIAKERGAIFIPKVLGEIFTNPNLKSDYIHPNAEGYKIITQRIYRVIRPYLEKNALLRESQK